MADIDYYDWPVTAQEIGVDDLKSIKAKLTHSACLSHDYFTIVRITYAEIDNYKLETLIVDVTPDIIQRPINDIRFTERLAIVFIRDNENAPDIFALRKSFPTVPHLNRTPIGSPKCLCIDDMDFEERKLTWTAEDMLFRIVNWLEKNARDTLHQTNQPVEPFFHHNASVIVLPEDFKDKEKHQNSNLLCRHAENTTDAITYVFDWLAKEEYEKIWKNQNERPNPVQILFLEAEPLQQGIIEDSPITLFALHDVMQKANIELIPKITDFIKSVVREKRCTDDDLLLLVFNLPITRQINSDVERNEHWAFCIDGTVKEIGIKLRALTDVNDGITEVYEYLGNDPLPDEDDMRVEILDPMKHLTPNMANLYNDLPQGSHERRFAMIGCGALGSALLEIYSRMGFGQWMVTDHDRFLPHNIARHSLSRPYIGMSKTHAFATHTLALFYESRITAFTENFLKVKPDSPFTNALEKTEAIIDASASIAVARKLALDIDTKARKMSVFITPSGKDSVLIAEDTDKQFSLDILEAQYYRELICKPLGITHLDSVPTQQRYGGGCREISAIIPYDTITVHAAILCEQIRKTLDNGTAQLSIWQHDEESGATTRSELPIMESFTLELGDWTITFDQCLLDKMTEQRQKALPNETGGPLIGYFDMLRQRIYIVTSLSSPPDSESSPQHYIRGKEGVRENCDEILKKTAGIVDFIGDWHSHPDSHSTAMSKDDLKLLMHHSLEMSRVGCPALIAILGENGQLTFYLGKCSLGTSNLTIFIGTAEHQNENRCK